ncbi:GapS6a family protein [Microbulbifer spongiae]|uniref:Uncharacterized protein n=1 Tax=Microbulbifer spongiae TaxID=2944933 RepID=A0ABY9EHM6_9GAMM|nr:hypothetical protein [Microbulbifer sp. MI-G]WKD51035.1 hypothetical protein M8T91_06335 [Microbulbifer sp. MI-G]
MLIGDIELKKDEKLISESITTAILASSIYDMLKHSLVLSAENLKSHLKKWIVDDSTLKTLENKISYLALDDEMSEAAIEKRLIGSDEIVELIRSIKPRNSTTIIQTHSGQGDNVAGNKVINH